MAPLFRQGTGHLTQTFRVGLLRPLGWTLLVAQVLAATAKVALTVTEASAYRRLSRGLLRLTVVAAEVVAGGQPQTVVPTGRPEQAILLLLTEEAAPVEEPLPWYKATAVRASSSSAIP
jgi:hypothetical protein